MSTLAKAHRAKLAKLLGMLSSDHAGERDAAACAAQRLVAQHGLSWQQILDPPPIEKKLPEMGVWRATVAQLLEHPGLLRPWERAFLQDLPAFRRISTRQRYCLVTIRDRVLGEQPR